MFKKSFKLRNVVAIAICLAASATMFAQDEMAQRLSAHKWATALTQGNNEFDGEHAGKWVNLQKKRTSVLRSGNDVMQRLDSVVSLENYKEVFLYNTHGYSTEDLSYFWNGTEWENNVKCEYTYDDNGNQTQIIFYYRDVMKAYYEYTYDLSCFTPNLIFPSYLGIKMNNKLTELKSYNHNNTDWVTVTCYWSEQNKTTGISTILPTAIQFYPNPTTGQLIINSEQLTILFFTM